MLLSNYHFISTEDEGVDSTKLWINSLTAIYRRHGTGHKNNFLSAQLGIHFKVDTLTKVQLQYY